MRPHADIVFLMRSGANNRPIIEAVASVLPQMQETILAGCGPIELRFKVCGYSDVLSCGPSGWWVEGPFTQEILQAQNEMQALDLHNGGDEPESLLDGLWKLANMPSASQGGAADPGGWRHARDARRFVVIFTNSSCHMTTQSREAAGAGLEDVIGKVMDARLRILLFAPEAACYVDLSVADRLEWEVVGDLVDSVGSMAQFAGRSDQWAPQVAKSILAGICRAEALAGEATKSEPPS